MLDLVISAEDVVADAPLALFKPTDDRLGAADDRQPLLDVEVVALARKPHGVAARLVVRPFAVASHAARMRAPADAGLFDRAAADRHRAALAARQILARPFVGLGVGLGDMHLPHQKHARHWSGVTAFLP